MHLINTKTYELCEFLGREIPVGEYAILSHRWEGREVSFREIQDASSLSNDKLAISWHKIKSFCDLAASRDIAWAWVDTCCIDKSSSAELQEAVNSMFKWYQNSKTCIAFLSDIDKKSVTGKRTFKQSLWFTRGWTLQEMIAPRAVEFFDCSWSFIGTRKELCAEISEVTQVPIPLLYDNEEYRFEWICVAQRMSWASKRLVTREEDESYCLFGIFNVNLPLLYGEGAINAFQRLQQEIIRKYEDDSIFGWWEEGIPSVLPLLARSPAAFSLSKHVERVFLLKSQPNTVTNRGVVMKTQIYPSTPENLANLSILCELDKGQFNARYHSFQKWIALLNCSSYKKRLAVLLAKRPGDADIFYKLGVCTLESSLSEGQGSEIVVSDIEVESKTIFTALDVAECVIKQKILNSHRPFDSSFSEKLSLLDFKLLWREPTDSKVEERHPVTVATYKDPSNLEHTVEINSSSFFEQFNFLDEDKEFLQVMLKHEEQKLLEDSNGWEEKL